MKRITDEQNEVLFLDESMPKKKKHSLSNNDVVQTYDTRDFRPMFEYANHTLEVVREKFNKCTSNLFLVEYKYKQLKLVNESSKKELEEIKVQNKELKELLAVNKSINDETVAKLNELKVQIKRVNGELDQQLKCPICMLNYKDVKFPTFIKSTGCGHVFCNECIDSWLKNNKKCPTCREKTFLRESFRIFL